MVDAVASIQAAATLLERGHVTQDEFIDLKRRILTADLVNREHTDTQISDGPREAPFLPRHRTRLLQLTRQMGPSQTQKKSAAADKSSEALHAEQKATEEAAFKRMYRAAGHP